MIVWHKDWKLPFLSILAPFISILTIGAYLALQELINPISQEEINASGGMDAFGDFLMLIFSALHSR